MYLKQQTQISSIKLYPYVQGLLLDKLLGFLLGCSQPTKLGKLYL